MNLNKFFYKSIQSFDKEQENYWRIDFNRFVLLSVTEKPFQTSYGPTIDNGMVSDLLILTFTPTIRIAAISLRAYRLLFLPAPFESSDGAREVGIFKISPFVTTT